MFRIIIIINILIIINQCGTTGELFLYEGIEDRSCYIYPPEMGDDPSEDSEESQDEESSIIYTDEGNIINEDGTIKCRPNI